MHNRTPQQQEQPSCLLYKENKVQCSNEKCWLKNLGRHELLIALDMNNDDNMEGTIDAGKLSDQLQYLSQTELKNACGAINAQLRISED